VKTVTFRAWKKSRRTFFHGQIGFIAGSTLAFRLFGVLRAALTLFNALFNAGMLLPRQLDAGRNRPIGEITHLVLDATYEKIRHNGAVRSCAVLTAIGIDTAGKWSVIGCNVQLSEAEPHWRKFLESLQKRGIHGVKLIVSDDHAGLRAARQAVMAGAPWQRCQFHTIRNAMAHAPKEAMRSEVARDLRRVFDADEPAEAEPRLKDVIARYQKTDPQLAT